MELTTYLTTADADTVLARVGLVSLDATVARILSVWDGASDADKEAGARWYGDDASAVLSAVQAASGGTLTREQAAVVVSHLSPRTTWARNVAAAVALVSGGPAAALGVGAMRANVDRAVRSIAHTHPLRSFGPTAHKTRAFARNLLGDRDAVTVDVWAARVAGCDDERTLKRVGVYAALSTAYRHAALARMVDPTTMQAATWVAARNGRAG